MSVLELVGLDEEDACRFLFTMLETETSSDFLFFLLFICWWSRGDGGGEAVGEGRQEERRRPKYGDWTETEERTRRVGRRVGRR